MLLQKTMNDIITNAIIEVRSAERMHLDGYADGESGSTEFGARNESDSKVESLCRQEKCDLKLFCRTK